MLNSKLKKFAQENDLTAAHGVAYGYFNDFLLTLSQDSGDVTAVFSALIADEANIQPLNECLNSRNFLGEYLIRKTQVSKTQITVTFQGSTGIVKQLQQALTAVTEKLREYGAKGKGYCPYCGQPTYGTEDMYLINGAAMQLHAGCLETVEGGFAENAEAAKTNGSVLTGAVGAALGAIVGAIPWAVVSFFGWFVGYLGLLISFVSCKGYEMLHGKETKIKGIIVLVVSLLAVVLAEYVAMLASLMKEFPGTPLSTCFVALNEAIRYDPEMQAIVIKDLVMGWLFAVLGMYSTIKQIFTNVKQTSGEIIKL
jgi:hypothetical protein